LLGLIDLILRAELNIVTQKLRESIYKKGHFNAFAGLVKALIVVPIISLLKDIVGYRARDTQVF